MRLPFPEFLPGRHLKATGEKFLEVATWLLGEIRVSDEFRKALVGDCCEVVYSADLGGPLLAAGFDPDLHAVAFVRLVRRLVVHMFVSRLYSAAKACAGGDVALGTFLLEQALEQAGEGDPDFDEVRETLHAGLTLYPEFMPEVDQLAGPGSRPETRTPASRAAARDDKRGAAWAAALSDLGEGLMGRDARPLGRKIGEARAHAWRSARSAGWPDHAGPADEARKRLARGHESPLGTASRTTGPEGSDVAVDAQLIRDVAERVLKKRHQEVLLLRVERDLTFEEIAAEVGRPETTVREDYQCAVRKVSRALR